MSITKVGDKWLLDMRPNGQKGSRIRKRFDRKAEAVQYEKKLLAGKIAERETDKRTLNELIEFWYEHHGKNLHSGTGTHRRLLAYSKAINNPHAIQHSSVDFVH